MAEEKKDKKKSGIVIVVGTGGPKKPTKTADPCMNKAWEFLNKNTPRAPPVKEETTESTYQRGKPSSDEERMRRDRIELGLTDPNPQPQKTVEPTGRLKQPNPDFTPSRQLEAQQNISLGATNRGPPARPGSWEGNPYGPGEE